MSKLKRKQVINRLRWEYGHTKEAKRRDEILVVIAIVKLLP